MKKRVKEIGIALSADELEQFHDMRVLLANMQNTLKKITFVDTSEEIKELSSCMKQLYCRIYLCFFRYILCIRQFPVP